jgi:alkylation response protein AidB-like acyl-CoA dehydrogenase
VDFSETAEQALLRAEVRRIARRHGHASFVRCARAGTAAHELWDDLAAGGFLGVNLPVEHGGAGLGIEELAIVCEELAAAGYRLRGSKQFISFVDDAAAILVVAATAGGLSLFLVDSDAPGLQRAAIAVEMTATERQFTLFFDDVHVPADRLLGGEGDGLRQVFAGLNPERITGAAVCNGIALYALERACAYARERRVWDAPIGSHQGIAHPLARAKIEVELARLMTRRAAWLYDTGGDAGEAANMAKYAAAEAGLAALDQAIQTHGGNGLTSEYGLADLWGVARLLRIAPVSREMILNHVAHHALALPRSH